MSYQVLARKWRPKVFAELVGQEHVVRALSHALDHDRVHHAFLFTGTRGVGKTTIARIFAKSLNCDRGISSNPCGECSACLDIASGRFYDLLEIDAASNTGVDDVREVIENAQYAPARGRYKVYLIDEVHMLSKSAFNALLKTLEEPPPHVKFLLATTDPQKLPVTVLSRCLQFNLRRLSVEQIKFQLDRILLAEAIEFEQGAVAQIARGGNGSMRDALSLLDQAIAFGGGVLRASEVQSMLGTLDRSGVVRVLDAIMADDAAALYREIESIAQLAPDFAAVLDELATLLHRVQIAQLVPGFAASAEDEGFPLAELATRISVEEVQLLYQLAITSRRDLPLAPSPRAGFEMALMRLLAFRPSAAAAGSTSMGNRAPSKAVSMGQENKPSIATTTSGSTAPSTRERAPSASPKPAPRSSAEGYATSESPTRASNPGISSPARAEEPAPMPVRDARARVQAHEWLDLIEALGLKGPSQQFAVHIGFVADEGNVIRVSLDPKLDHLHSPLSIRTVGDALSTALSRAVSLKVEAPSQPLDTAAARAQRTNDARQSAAEESVRNDPLIQQMAVELGARVIPGSIRPRDAES